MSTLIHIGNELNKKHRREQQPSEFSSVPLTDENLDNRRTKKTTIYTSARQRERGLNLK